MTTPIWKIETLGPLCVRRGEYAVTRFRTHKTGALLAYLALNAERPVSRETLIDLFWPDPDMDGRNCLRLALTALRRLFEDKPGEAAVLDVSDFDAPASDCMVLASRAHALLNRRLFATDIDEFEGLLLDAAHASQDGDKIVRLQRALAVYRADLLPDYEDDWIRGLRQNLAGQRQVAMRRLVALFQKIGDFPSALAQAQSAVEADPFCEDSQRLLMQMYAASGQQSAALEQYHALERLLMEMNARPSAPTRALARELGADEALPVDRNSSPVATISPSASAAPSFPFAPRFAPPSPRREGNLPAPVSRFFGQEDNLTRVVEMLRAPHTRLITLTGLGGTGKTRLALAAGEKMRDLFDGAIWFVSLAPVTDAGRILDAVAQALSLPQEHAGFSLLEQIAQAFGAAPTLLILDNFEHLADQGARTVRNLLDAVPYLVCLVTSRQRLNLTGEYEFTVSPLPTPQATGTPERLLEFASVQLFVDRAQAARSDFQLTRDNAVAVASLCHYLEGVPLAIELAAAYAQILTPAQIVKRLSSRLAVPPNRSKDAPARHASLRATLDWSFELLEPGLQRVFARLSVFRGGWSLEAAEAVCAEPPPDASPDIRDGTALDWRDFDRADALFPADVFDGLWPDPAAFLGGDAMEALMQLRERSLIQMEAAGAQNRYVMLETLREYAAERLARLDARDIPIQPSAPGPPLNLSHAAQGKPVNGPLLADRYAGQERDARRCHSAYFLRLAQEGAPHLFGPQAGEWLRELQQEQENLRAALAFLLAPDAGCRHAPSDADSDGLVLAGALWRFWHARGRYEEGRDWLEKALRRFPDAPAALRLTALRGLGNLAYEQGDLARAQSAFEEHLETANACRDTLEIAAAMGNLGNVAYRRGDLEQAGAWRKQSLALFQQAGDRRSVALMLSNLGNLAEAQGDYAQAIARYQEGLEILRAMGDSQNTLIALNNLTLALLRCSRENEARACLRENLRLARDNDNKHGLLQTLNIFVFFLERHQQYRHAADVLGCAQALIEQIHLSSASHLRADFGAQSASAREALGEREFDERMHYGRLLSLDQLLALLDVSGPAPI